MRGGLTAKDGEDGRVDPCPALAEAIEDERPGAGQALRLIGCETLEGGMVWLRHKVEDAPAPTP